MEGIGSAGAGTLINLCLDRDRDTRHISSRGINMDPTSPIRIRMVRVLSGRAREAAEEAGYAEDDLVIVRVRVKEHSVPDYTLEKITGNPLEYLQEHLR
jgi:hypothetical protein